jgi:lysozyme family protein
VTSRLDRALDFTLEHEGGWSDRKNDKGGKTNWGITLAVLKGLGRDVDLDGDVDADDLRALPKEEARAIYENLYWFGDPFLDDAVAIKHFDIGVHAGPGTANKILQRAINNFWGRPLLAEDGHLGPKTLAAANALPPKDMLQALCAEQLGHYLNIIRLDPTQIEFQNGWIKRAKRKP